MLFGSDTIDDSLLKRHLMELAAGDYLFRQNEKGNTLYIILQGKIQLSHRVHNAERLVGTLGEGEVVGERAILGEGPHRRSFSAIATQDSQLLEFDNDALKAMQKTSPDFALKLLGLVLKRLDKANFLVSVLQLPETVDRLVHYLHFLHQYSGIKEASGNGVRIPLTLDELALGANADRAIAEQCLSACLRKGVLRKVPDGYLIPDENALLEYLPTLKERAAA